MSALVSLSEYFYAVCGHLADGIETTKGIVRYIAATNYNIVAAVISFISFIAETVWMILEGGLHYLQVVFVCMTNFLNSVGEFGDSIFSSVYKMMVAMYSTMLNAYDSIMSLNSSVVNLLSETVCSVKNAVFDVYDVVASVFSLSVASIVSLVVAVYMCLASFGQFCVSAVTGVWHFLGYTLSSIAYFPVYCYECLESAKNHITHNIIHAVTAMPKETYLVMICLCLSYFTVSNAVRYVSSRGFRKLFSSRLRSSSRAQRTSGVEWQFIDRDFESDFEDLYGNDVNNGNVWMVPVAAEDTRNGAGRTNDESDGESDQFDQSSDSDAVGDEDDDLSDDDDDDDDEGSEGINTHISDDSDSDNSLNSQTLSNESSEHEIEVSLPSVDERYSLRSRSSTPSSTCPKSLSSPEEFEREMEREKDKRKCVVCQDQVKSVLIMPCRHMCMCVLCADHIVRSRSAARRVCPLCRTKIQKVMNVYV